MKSKSWKSRPTGEIGVLEARPFLAPELRRQFEGDEISVRSFRLVNDLVTMASPRVCVLALESDEDAIVNFVRKVGQEPGTACVVLVSGNQFTDGEWFLREMGAQCVLDPFIRGDELARICRNLLNSIMNREQTQERHV